MDGVYKLDEVGGFSIYGSENIFQFKIMNAYFYLVYDYRDSEVIIVMNNEKYFGWIQAQAFLNWCKSIVFDNASNNVEYSEANDNNGYMRYDKKSISLCGYNYPHSEKPEIRILFENDLQAKLLIEFFYYIVFKKLSESIVK